MPPPPSDDASHSNSASRNPSRPSSPPSSRSSSRTSSRDERDLWREAQTPEIPSRLFALLGISSTGEPPGDPPPGALRYPSRQSSRRPTPERSTNPPPQPQPHSQPPFQTQSQPPSQAGQPQPELEPQSVPRPTQVSPPSADNSFRNSPAPPACRNDLNAVGRMAVLFDQITRLRAHLEMSPFLPGSSLGASAHPVHDQRFEVDGLTEEESQWVQEDANRKLIKNAVLLEGDASHRCVEAYAGFCAELASRADAQELGNTRPPLPCLAATPLQTEKAGDYDPLIAWVPYAGIRDRLILHPEKQAAFYADRVIFVLLQYQSLHHANAEPSNWELAPTFMEYFPHLIDPTTLKVTNEWRSKRGEDPITEKKLEEWINDQSDSSGSTIKASANSTPSSSPPSSQ